MKFDLIIIGEGLAALSLILHLPENLKIGVISRNKHSESSSFYAQGGISAVYSAEDNLEKHVQDTLIAGDGLCDEKVAKQIVAEGPSALQWLIDSGIPFTEEDGLIHLTREGGHSERRVAHVDDMTGRAIMQTLVQKVSLLPNIVWIRQHEALELLSDGQSVSGVITQSLIDQEISIFYSPKIVLATGGVTGLYPYATNPTAGKGEAIAMAWRAGAAIENLEFIQFHPTAFLVDGKVVSLITEAVRGEGGYLYNSENIRFMEQYSSQKELAPRDVVSRAIYSEMKIHSSSHVYLDISHKGASFVEQHFPNLTKLTNAYGVDLSTSRVPVSPAAHYTCGGIGADVTGKTSVGGLYAIGEVANSGLHGANRLASNSLLECVVMGRACAQSIQSCGASIANHSPPRPLDVIETSLTDEILGELRTILWSSAGIVRTDAGLNQGLKQLVEIEGRQQRLKPYGQALRNRNIFDAASLMLQSAAARKESRGGHFNEDHPLQSQPQKTSIDGLVKSYCGA